MANLDVGTGSDMPDAGGGPPGLPGGSPPMPPGMPPPPAAMQRQRPSMPGAGNIGDALQKVAEAASSLGDALNSFPHGSKERGELVRVIGILNKIGPGQAASGALQQTSLTSARDNLRRIMQMALAGRAGQIQQQNPGQQPTMAAPGV